jgi:hypothetical protein
MSAPNIEGTSNPTSTGGNTMGVVVGSNATETVGFFGSAGVTQPTSASVVDYPSLKLALQALGLIGS